MKESRYFKQAALMLRLLPLVARLDCFALKGGTAINFFVEQMPRLSVDIDLVYLPLRDRSGAIKAIGIVLEELAASIERLGYRVQRSSLGQDNAKLVISDGSVAVKIEPNTVLRGTVFPPEERVLCSRAEELFELSVRGRISSIADLYGGKLCAALDRQHPRDLFDVKLLWDRGGMTDHIRKAFVVYVASHPRPMHELLCPRPKDIARDYKSDFAGMTEEMVSCEELEEVRDTLVTEAVSKLQLPERDFLLSLKQGTPKWELLGIEGLDRLPALQWKLSNIQKMSSRKHQEQLEELKRILEL